MNRRQALNLESIPFLLTMTQAHPACCRQSHLRHEERIYPRRATAKRSKTMTGRQKRYWQILATFLLGGAVAGVAYNVVRGHLAPINFATGATFGLMIASGIGA